MQTSDLAPGTMVMMHTSTMMIVGYLANQHCILCSSHYTSDNIRLFVMIKTLTKYAVSTDYITIDGTVRLYNEDFTDATRLGSRCVLQHRPVVRK